MASWSDYQNTHTELTKRSGRTETKKYTGEGKEGVNFPSLLSEDGFDRIIAKKWKTKTENNKCHFIYLISCLFFHVLRKMLSFFHKMTHEQLFDVYHAHTHTHL